MLLSIPVMALAGTQSWNNDGVTITCTASDTYYLCPLEPSIDTISVTGLPAGWELIGWVESQFLVPSGRQTIDYYSVNFTSYGLNPFELTVEYPPIDQWPATHDPDGGLREIHVDISIVVYD